MAAGFRVPARPSSPRSRRRNRSASGKSRGSGLTDYAYEVGSRRYIIRYSVIVCRSPVEN